MTDDDHLKKAAEAAAKLQQSSESLQPLQPPDMLEALDSVEPDADEAGVALGDAASSPYAGEDTVIEDFDVESHDVEGQYVEWPEAEAAEAAPAAPSRRRISPRSPRQAIEPELAPPPPTRSRQVRHPLVVVLNFFMMAGVLAVLIIGAALYFGSVQFNAEGPLKESKTVLISRGADLESIAGLLQRQNVIDSSLVFSNGVRLSKVANKLKAGEYLFEAGASMRDVMTALVSGKAILHGFTVPEGLTSEQVVARLADDPVLTGELAAIPAEGTLMPDTYKFSRGSTREQIVDQMRRAQEHAVAEIWERRSNDLPISTPEQLITLASIVEKETGKADERPLVAAVFINRLRQNIRLQSDPTIVYGMFGGKGLPADRPIFRSDIDKQTPYNTYQIDGLPPGPIANPGRAALEAVANPSRTDDLYFVADGSGGHVFAKTLDEHNRNVTRWRRIEAERRKAEEAARKAEEAARKAEEAARKAEESAAGASTQAAPQAGTTASEAGEVGGEAADGTVLEDAAEAGGSLIPKAKPQ